MKTPQNKILFVALVATCFLETGAFAQSGSYNWENPRPTNEIVRSLEAQVLSDEQIGDIVNRRRETIRPVSDLELVIKLGIKPPPSQEGIPLLAHPDKPLGVMGDAYTSAELIEKAIQDRETRTMGKRIDFLIEQAAQIIEYSGEKEPEVLMRLTLNRAVDLINHVHPIIGGNTDYVARLMANVLLKNFQRAAMYANNSVGVDSQIFKSPTAVRAVFRRISIADFGRIHAQALTRMAQDSGISNGSKAVITMRMMGYLGWDFNADLLRREPPLAKTIYDIYQFQHSDLYRRILSELASNQEPEDGEVSDLYDRASRIVETLDVRLQQAGILKL